MLNSARRIKQGVLSGANRMHALSSVKHACMFCMRYSMSTRFSQAGAKVESAFKAKPQSSKAPCGLPWLDWYWARA